MISQKSKLKKKNIRCIQISTRRERENAKEREREREISTYSLTTAREESTNRCIASLKPEKLTSGKPKIGEEPEISGGEKAAPILSVLLIWLIFNLYIPLSRVSAYPRGGISLVEWQCVFSQPLLLFCGCVVITCITRVILFAHCFGRFVMARVERDLFVFFFFFH